MFGLTISLSTQSLSTDPCNECHNNGELKMNSDWHLPTVDMLHYPHCSLLHLNTPLYTLLSLSHTHTHTQTQAQNNHPVYGYILHSKWIEWVVISTSRVESKKGSKTEAVKKMDYQKLAKETDDSNTISTIMWHILG